MVRMKEHEYEMNSMLLFMIMMTANLLNYLFQVVMGKTLTVVEFGTLNALLSIIALFSVLSTIITMVTAKSTAAYLADSQPAKVRMFFTYITKLTFWCALIVLIAGIGFSSSISDLLNIENSYQVTGTMVIVSCSMFVATTTGILQGQKRFFHYGISGLLTTVIKLSLSVVLVAVGFGLFGILFAILLGTILSYTYGLMFIRKTILVSQSIYRGNSIDSNLMLHDIALVLFAQVCISLFVNGDILVVKALFSPKEAGVYSMTMIFGKISMYITTAIVAVLFPMVTEKSRNGLETKHLLIKSLLYTGGLSIMCAVGINLTAKSLVGMLFGVDYLITLPLLLPASTYIIPVTLLIILVNYQIAIGRVMIMNRTLIFSLFGCSISIWLFHTSISQMLYSMAAVLFAGIVVNTACILRFSVHEQML